MVTPTEGGVKRFPPDGAATVGNHEYGLRIAARAFAPRTPRGARASEEGRNGVASQGRSAVRVRAAMQLSDFDFELPDSLIAQTPLAERDASRLLVLPRTRGAPSHRMFRDLPSLLREGDLLVFNDARVIPARLPGRKAGSGGRVELLLTECVPSPEGESGERWKCLGKASKGLRAGQRVVFDEGFDAEVLDVTPEGALLVRLSLAGDALLEALWRRGEIPLPPYIRHESTPAEHDPHATRYQTIFATKPGASAAPTAGLHFTEHTLAELERVGVSRALVTLYVGPGTFLPVRTENVLEHHMHTERFDVPQATAEAVRATRERGGRVIAVGTTSLRALEAAGKEGDLVPGPGATDLFLLPGSRFNVVDGLVTNFHLPKSTLLMLIAALAGRERVLDAYAEAVREKYRFFSYGDAMLIAD